VVSSAVVFDSSAHHFNTATPINRPGSAPPLWSAPGEHEYSFSLMPLGAPPVSDPDTGAASSALAASTMSVTFRRVMSFCEKDVVEEAAPKPPTKHLDPYRRNPKRNSHLEPIRAIGSPKDKGQLGKLSIYMFISLSLYISIYLCLYISISIYIHI